FQSSAFAAAFCDDIGNCVSASDCLIRILCLNDPPQTFILLIQFLFVHGHSTFPDVFLYITGGVICQQIIHFAIITVKNNPFTKAAGNHIRWLCDSKLKPASDSLPPQLQTVISV